MTTRKEMIALLREWEIFGKQVLMLADNLTEEGKDSLRKRLKKTREAVR